jgi:hypothetical protein
MAGNNLHAKVNEFQQLKQASLRKLASTPTAYFVNALHAIDEAILPSREEIINEAKIAGTVVNEIVVDGRVEHTKIASVDYADVPYYLQGSR